MEYDLTDKEWQLILLLRSADAFSVHGGKVVISFDSQGNARYADTERRTMAVDNSV